MAADVVELLKREGYSGIHLRDSIAGWAAMVR